jgi:hypothetical protein
LTEETLLVFFCQGPEHPMFCDTIHWGRLLLEKIRIGFFYLIFFWSLCLSAIIHRPC